jgi:hypothetical protein
VYIGSEKNDSLGKGAKNHCHDEYWSSPICVRVGWQNEEPNEHAHHVAGADKANVLGGLAQEIKLLDPVVDVFRVSLIKSEQVLVDV